MKTFFQYYKVCDSILFHLCTGFGLDSWSITQMFVKEHNNTKISFNHNTSQGRCYLVMFRQFSKETISETTHQQVMHSFTIQKSDIVGEK